MRRLKWLEYCLADEANLPEIDSDWAEACTLAVMCHVHSTRALVGHFVPLYSNDERRILKRLNIWRERKDPESVLRRMLKEANNLFNGEIRMIIRGGSCCFDEEDDDWPDFASALEEQEQRRGTFLRIVAEEGIPDDRLDIVWAQNDTATRIIYSAMTGNLVEQTKRV